MAYKHKWAVGHYDVSIKTFRRLKERIYLPTNSGRWKRQLFRTWRQEARYAMKANGRRGFTGMSIVYRVGRKPVRVYRWTIN